MGEGAKDVDSPDFVAKDWMCMIDAIKEWLCRCLGISKIPLAYLIRPEGMVLLEAQDLCMMYASTVLELVSHAPILTSMGAYSIPDYLKDQELLFTMEKRNVGSTREMND